MVFLYTFTANLIFATFNIPRTVQSHMLRVSSLPNLFHANLDGPPEKKVLIRDPLIFGRCKLDTFETLNESYCQSETRLLA